MRDRVSTGFASLMAGIVLTIVMFAVCFSFAPPRGDALANVLLQPMAAIVQYGPGGKEDPLLLLVGLPAQVLVYSAISYVALSTFQKVRQK